MQCLLQVKAEAALTFKLSLITFNMTKSFSLDQNHASVFWARPLSDIRLVSMVSCHLKAFLGEEGLLPYPSRTKERQG